VGDESFARRRLIRASWMKDGKLNRTDDHSLAEPTRTGLAADTPRQ
jgi:hypothetical protein